MLIADELLLLSLDEESGNSLASEATLDASMGAALLVELALMGRITASPPGAESRHHARVSVTDPTPTGDPDLDGVLARLQSKPDQRAVDLISPKGWHSIGYHLRDSRLGILRHQGVLAEKHGGLFGHTRHPTRDPEPERETRARLTAALEPGSTPTDRTVALVILADAAGLLPKLVPNADPETVKARAHEFAEGSWQAKAIRDAVHEMATRIASTAPAAAPTGATPAHK